MTKVLYTYVSFWSVVLLFALVAGGFALSAPAQPSKGLVDDIIDPLLGEEGEGEDGVIDDIVDPILGEEGEGDGGVIDDIVDPILGEEGEGEGGLLDAAIDLLPNPIVGLDPFEPDNTPAEARWSGLVNSDLINDISDLTGLLRTHNFHVDGDEDWVRFYARAGQIVRIETRDLLSRADTFLSVYRTLRVGEANTSTPNECIDDSIEGPLGTTLVPVACNDNTAGAIDTRRSLVQFEVEVTGYYYSRVRFSPNASQSGGNKGTGDSGPETTYNYAGSYSGVISSTLYCTVLADEDGDPITDALVQLEPGGIEQTYNQSGVYPIDSIPSGVYTVTVSAPGRETEQAVVNIGDGEQKEVTVYLLASEPPAEGEGVGPEGEGEGGGEFGVHASDFMSPYGQISLEELLRVIQFYNARSYHCSEATEDGYAPYPGDRTCLLHTGDYDPGDWTHSLNELLRVIQLFNVGGFVACEESEDGVCPVES